MGEYSCACVFLADSIISQGERKGWFPKRNKAKRQYHFSVAAPLWHPPSWEDSLALHWTFPTVPTDTQNISCKMHSGNSDGRDTALLTQTTLHPSSTGSQLSYFLVGFSTSLLLRPHFSWNEGEDPTIPAAALEPPDSLSPSPRSSLQIRQCQKHRLLKTTSLCPYLATLITPRIPSSTLNASWGHSLAHV